MKNILKKSFGVVVVCASVMASTAHADTLVFNVSPSNGDISGAPGTTIGWGYSITNNSSNYLVTTAINADVFQYSMPLAIFDFPVVAPGSTATEGFAIDSSGLFQLSLDVDIPLGFVNSGLFSLSSDFYTNDPLLGGMFISSAEVATAGYSAIAQADITAVPEPSTLSLWLVTLLAFSVRLFILRNK